MQSRQRRKGLKIIGTFREALDVLIYQTSILRLSMNFKYKTLNPQTFSPKLHFPIFLGITSYSEDQTQIHSGWLFTFFSIIIISTIYKSRAGSIIMVLKLGCASESPERLVETQIAGPHPQSFRISRSGLGTKNLHF